MTSIPPSTIDRQPNRALRLDHGLLLALLLPIFAVMPLLLHAGLPNTADGPAHLMRQVELNQAWQQGNYYPRWGTDLAFGHGMPIFSYAPPLLYQLSQLFHLTGLPLDEAMKAVVIFDFLLYSLGMFLLARRLYGPQPALIAAALYVYAPYRLREAYIQGNYGQFTGLAFYPLLFWAGHGLITEGRPAYLIATALSLAGLLFSHNISVMLVAPMFGAYLLWLLILNRRGDTSRRHHGALTGPPPPPQPSPSLGEGVLLPWLHATAAVLLGLNLAAIFWLPAFGERHDIRLEGIVRGFFDFRENFISAVELFAPPLPLDLAAINPEFPLSLGLPQIIGAGLGLLGIGWGVVTGFRRKIGSNEVENRSTALALFFILFLIIYCFLALPQSQPWWEVLPLLDLAEFPWRMLGPAIFCAALVAAAGFRMVDRHTWLLPLSLLLITSLNSYYLYPSQFIVWGTPSPADAFAYEVSSGAIGTTSTGEFLPRGAEQQPDPAALWPDYEAGRWPQKLDPAGLPAGATAAMIDHRAEADAILINTPTAFTATLRTLYWPGWEIYLDGRPAIFTVADPTGLFLVSIPPGEHTLSLILESTPLRRRGQQLTIAALLVLLAIGVRALIGRWRTRTSPLGTPSASNRLTGRLAGLTALLLVGTWLLSRPLEPLFTLSSDPNQPQPADQVVRVDFGDQLRLVGLAALPTTVEVKGQTTRLPVTVYWRALQDLDQNYAVFLHLDAPDGRTVATTDEAHPENTPTRNWPPGLYLRNVLELDIPPDVPPIRYDLNLGLVDRTDGQRLHLATGAGTTFKLGSIWVVTTQADQSAAPVAHFGPDITLRRVELPQARQTELIFDWQTTTSIEGDYTIFVHLLDETGAIIGQLDGAPYEGLYPPTNWRPGQIITDRRHLPPDLPHPPAALAIGFYDPTSGQRLPATDAAGNPLPDGRLILPFTP